MIISIDSEKAFEGSASFMKKAIIKVGIEGTYLNIINSNL